MIQDLKVFKTLTLSLLMTCGFTYKHYKEILQHFLAAQYQPTFFHEFDPQQTHQLLLRHDVDLIQEDFLEIPIIEDNLRFKSTYYFLIDSPFYNAKSEHVQYLIKVLRSFGHDIGVHVDGSKIHSSIELMNHLRLAYEIIGDYSSYSFHKPSTHDFTLNHCLVPCTYHPKFFKDIDYRSDSSMEWRGDCICKHPLHGQNIQLLIHTCWWNEDNDERNYILEEIIESNIIRFRNELKKDLPFFADNRFCRDTHDST